MLRKQGFIINIDIMLVFMKLIIIIILKNSYI